MAAQNLLSKRVSYDEYLSGIITPLLKFKDSKHIFFKAVLDNKITNIHHLMLGQNIEISKSF